MSESENLSPEQGFSDQRLRRAFVLFTADEVPCIDRLAIIMELFKEMSDHCERRAALSYITDFYGYRIYPR